MQSNTTKSSSSTATNTNTCVSIQQNNNDNNTFNTTTGNTPHWQFTNTNKGQTTATSLEIEINNEKPTKSIGSENVKTNTNITPSVQIEEPNEIDEKKVAIENVVKSKLSPRGKIDNYRENKFVGGITLLCVIIIIICIVLSQTNPEHFVLDLMFFPTTLVLLVIESIWNIFLSFLVLKYDIKVNYTRKLAHLLRIPKYFLIGYLPGFEKNETTILLVFVCSQILYILMFHRKMRENVCLFEFIFIAQNRLEDQPSTLQFQITEDFMRFFVYFPITLWISYKDQNEAIIFIPQMINSIGDGLAEPVGIRFGKHKYKTFALYFDGKWFNGQFTRSIEGSLCVFFTTVIVISIEYFIGIFSNAQLLYLLMTLPFYMTIAEAIAPHTNDGPFLALTGCFILILGYEIIDC